MINLTRRNFVKFSILIVYLFPIVLVNNGNAEKEYYVFVKVTKIFCNSSGISTTNVKCYVKPISRNCSVFGVSADIKKPLNDIMATIILDYKTKLAIKFMTIMTLRNQNICLWTKIAQSPLAHFLKGWIEHVNLTLNGVIHDCPYQGKFQIVNASYNLNNEDQKKANSFQKWPNGVYKIQVRFHNKNDDNIGSFTYWHEYYTRENHLNGMESF